METQDTPMIEITAEQANQLRKDAKEKLDLAQAVERLMANPDFKLLFETYIEKEANRLVSLLADPAINMGDKKEAFRSDIQECLQAVARFKFYIKRTVYQLAQQAEKLIEDIDRASIK